jgi:hypothetical protein
MINISLSSHLFIYCDSTNTCWVTCMSYPVLRYV